MPKASVVRNWVIRNLRRILLAIQEEQLHAECGAGLKNFYSLNLLCICPSLFETYLLTRQNIASTKNSQEFLAWQVSILRRNKATNSSTSNRPFFSCTESLVLSNLFKLVRLDITFAREVCRLGIKMKKILQSSLSYSFHYPQWQTARANVTANLRSLNKLPNTRVFVAAENGSVEVLELVALFLLEKETFGTKNW